MLILMLRNNSTTTIEFFPSKDLMSLIWSCGRVYKSLQKWFHIFFLFSFNYKCVFFNGNEKGIVNWNKSSLRIFPLSIHFHLPSLASGLPPPRHFAVTKRSVGFCTLSKTCIRAIAQKKHTHLPIFVRTFLYIQTHWSNTSQWSTHIQLNLAFCIEMSKGRIFILLHFFLWVKPYFVSRHGGPCFLFFKEL